MTFNFVALTEYFISIYFEGRIHQYGGGNQYWRNGDFSDPSVVWAGAGTARTDSWLTAAIEGWDTSSGPGWDSDVLLTNNINDWGKIKPLIYSKPFGTQAMIKSLNKGKNLISTRKNQISARNTALAHYRTYTIVASSDGPGIITPSGSVIVNLGENQTFTFTGTVSKIVIDDVNIPSAPSYTFTNVNDIHAIKVYFI
jgi:hypothetical protein